MIVNEEENNCSSDGKSMWECEKVWRREGEEGSDDLSCLFEDGRLETALNLLFFLVSQFTG